MITYFRVNITARATEKPHVHSWADTVLKDYGATITHRSLLDRKGDWVLLYIESELRITLDEFIDFRNRFIQCYRNGLSYGNERPFNGMEQMFAEMVAEIETWSILPSQPMDPQFVFGTVDDDG